MMAEGASLHCPLITKALCRFETVTGQLQIKHSYGAKPNEDFLQYYGFVDTDNIHDYYTADVLEWILQHKRVPEYGAAAIKADPSSLKALQQVCVCVCVCCSTSD